MVFKVKVPPICTLKQGVLKGKVETDRNGEEFFSFLGIPYAKPPTGKLRFKAPQPPDQWEGTRDATKDAIPCYAIQETITEKGLETKVRGSEDCLFLNVFTRELSNAAPKPVMVFIHGGAFLTGSIESTYFLPKFLLTEDIVLVTITYRLGALGFLSLEDPSLDVPGNAGLKDQVQALKWVQENIKAFGGDPGNVTIFGHSAGSASVHFLILSPLASGLFHKAIMQSGTVLMPSSFGHNNGKQLAETLGCKETDQTKILDFLQGLPVETIYEGQGKIGQYVGFINKRPFSANFEPLESPGAFISQQPLEIIQEGSYNHVPLMIGYTNLESKNMIGDSYFQIDLEEFVPYQYQLKRNSPKYNELSEKITKFYYETNNNPVAKDTLKPLQLVISDVMFVKGTHDTVKEHAKTATNPIFFYRLSKNAFIPSDGVGHVEDLFFFCPTKMGPADEITTLRFIKMWANFARWGNPTPLKTDCGLLGVEWKPVQKEVLNFLDIGEELVPGVDPDGDRMSFWDDIVKDIKQTF